MITAPMSWIHALEQFVPTGSLSKGRNYFRSGAVQIEKASEDRLEATVKGGGWYSVVLYLDMGEETVVASCTCPHYEDINLCKHIWATVLAAESKGYLRQIAKIDNPSIETEIEYEGLDSDVGDFGEDDADDEWNAPRSYRDESRRSVTKPAPVAPWKQHLTSVRTVMPAETLERNEGKRRIVYVADVSQSLSAGALVIQAAAIQLKKNGEWGKPAFQENSVRQVAQLGASDQRILALLAGSGEVYSYSSYSLSQPESIRARHRIPHAAQDFLLPLLCETERFYLKPAQSDVLFPMKWDSGPPWSFKVQVYRDDAAAEYSVKGVLIREGNEKPLAEPLLLVQGLVFFTDHVARFDDGDTFQWLKMLRTVGDLRVPFEQRNDFLHEIADFPVLPFVELPEELRIENLTLTNPPELKIGPMPESRWITQQKLACWITFDFAGVKV